MKITYRTLRTYVDNLYGISDAEVQRILNRHWCGPNGVRGLCSAECSHCAFHLQKAFQLDNARKPVALLIWNLRDELAAAQEEMHVHEFVPPLDSFGRLKAQREDVFSDLAKLFK